MARRAGARPVISDTGTDPGFTLGPARLEAALTPATRLLILNSPSNPTGACYRRAELNAIGEVLAAHPQVVIASDDIYEHIWWADQPFANIVNACPSLAPRCVVVNGGSKAYAMTGWRIGYAAGPVELIDAMKTIQGQSTSNPTSISQVAAAAALDGDQQSVRDMVATFRRRHDLVVERLNGMPGVRCAPAAGAFYAFPDVGAAIASLDGIGDDLALATHLLEHAGVAVVPGTAFGAPGHLRLSYATGDEDLERALNRIEAALES